MWWILWLSLMILFLLFEAITPQLTSIWLALGAAFALLVCAFANDMFWLQCIVFVVVSVVAVILTRPLAKKYLNGKRERLNADRCIGQEAVVIQDINNLVGSGQVNSKGTIWTARSVNDNITIPKDTTVIIERIEGVKVIVAVKK